MMAARLGYAAAFIRQDEVARHLAQCWIILIFQKNRFPNSLTGDWLLYERDPIGEFIIRLLRFVLGSFLNQRRQSAFRCIQAHCCSRYCRPARVKWTGIVMVLEVRIRGKIGMLQKGKST